MLRHRLIWFALLTLVPATTDGQSNSAAAEQLFRDGKAFMASSQYDEACDAFEGSQKLDPSVSTLANLADCRERNEQIATAWGLFVELDRQTRNDKTREALNITAKKRAAGLEPRISYLIINVPGDSSVDGLAITRNGEPVDEHTWNRALPIDGGAYVIEGKAPGHEAWSTKVTIAAERDKQSVDVPKFKELSPFAGEPGTGDHAADTPQFPSPRGETPSAGMSTKHKLAIVLGVVGLVGTGSAIAFEVSAEGNYRRAKDEPDDMEQAALTSQANRSRTIAIGAGIVGVLGLGTAAYLWVTGRSDSHGSAHAVVVPNVTADSAGIVFTRLF